MRPAVDRVHRGVRAPPHLDISTRPHVLHSGGRGPVKSLRIARARVDPAPHFCSAAGRSERLGGVSAPRPMVSEKATKRARRSRAGNVREACMRHHRSLAFALATVLVLGSGSGYADNANKPTLLNVERPFVFQIEAVYAYVETRRRSLVLRSAFLSRPWDKVSSPQRPWR